MSSEIYSNPLVHTAYYSRELFQTSEWRNNDAADGIKSLIFSDLKLKDTWKDFAFNVNTNCQGIENSTFMRLNACALLKLRHWCLHPTDSTTQKVAQYTARIFFSPLAATWDLTANTLLLGLKILAYPVIRLAKDLDSSDRDCLNANIYFQMKMVGDSIKGIFTACIGSLTWCLAGPQRASQIDMGSLWGYEVLLLEKSDLNETSKIEEKILLDTNRVRYLREHCGWEDLTDEQLKNMNPSFSPPNANVSYHIGDKLHLTLRGVHKWSTSSHFHWSTPSSTSSFSHTTKHTQPFRINKEYPLPSAQ